MEKSQYGTYAEASRGRFRMSTDLLFWSQLDDISANGIHKVLRMGRDYENVIICR